jgi:subtilase family serine protease
MYLSRRLLVILLLTCLLSACAPAGGSNNDSGATPAQKATRGTTQQTPTVSPPQSPTSTAIAVCPVELGSAGCRTPYDLRVAYGVQSLIQRGFTGKGQTIVDVVSYGSPTLQQDMDIFDKQFGLPPITIKVISPIGVVPFNPANKEMLGWAGETELDVQVIHAIAPDANIVVLTSPVDETEGTIGLPEFLQLEQYALAHYLGSIISQSWGASEVTLKDAAGQKEIQQWDAFFKQATTQQGITFFASSGDNGATDYADLKATILSPAPTTSFPTDDPWVTSVGGTSLDHNTAGFQETAWDRSGGGFSSFFSTPSYQQTLPSSVRGLLKNRRGVPDVAGDADPNTGLAIYTAGGWDLGGGTSASAPLWAAFMAIANQMAGHPLGFINLALYKLAASSAYTQDFHDITAGDNSVKGIDGSVRVQGHLAVQGWDPITGLGTPDAEKLLPGLIAAMQG